MKALITSDWHLTDRGHLITEIEDLYAERLRKIDTMIDYACNRKNCITDFFILGDLFDSKDVSYKVFSDFIYKYVMTLRGHKIQLHILAGNHDIYEENCVLRALQYIYGVRIYAGACSIELDGVNIDIVPFIEKGLSKEIKAFSGEGRFLFGHFSVNGFMMSNLYKCVDADISMKMLKRWKHVVLGHFHIPSDRGNVSYCGSPYPTSFGFADIDRCNRFLICDGKSIKSIDMDAKFLSEVYSLAYRTISIEEAAKSHYDENLFGKIVRLIYNADKNSVKEVEEVTYKLLRKNKAYYVESKHVNSSDKEDFVVASAINENTVCIDLNKYINTNYKSKFLVKKANSVMKKVARKNVGS